MSVTTLSANLHNSFGFSTKVTDDTSTTFIGIQTGGDEWYVAMNKTRIALCVQDLRGNQMWAIVENSDNCQSGFEASILIKQFYAYLKNAYKGNKKITAHPSFSFNGRKITSIYLMKA